MGVFLPKYKTDKGEVRTSKVYWIEFMYQGLEIRESSRTRSITLAKRILERRRRELEEGVTGIRKPSPPKMFKVAAEHYLHEKRATLAASSWSIEAANLKHLIPEFGRRLLSDIVPADISRYQQLRLGKDAAPRTINLEFATLRAILKRQGFWSRIQPQVRMIPVRNDIGKALSPSEESALLYACAESRSRSLLPFVILAIETGARYGVIRTLRWGDIDFSKRCVRFGKDKTPAGTGRIVPLNSRALSTLEFWARHFPTREPSHFVFARERYGGAGKIEHFGFNGGSAYDTDPTQPMGEIKEAWDSAKRRAGRLLKGDSANIDSEPAPLTCRFHDFRHTAVSRMLDAGVPLTKVAKIVGWSTSTMVQMAARYGHFTLDELRGAVDTITRTDEHDGSAEGTLKAPRFQRESIR
jgi:integrase